MIKLVEIPCTQCGNEMHLPEHVADLPAHARLCAVCVRALLRDKGDEVMDELNYVLKAGFFIDGSPERLLPYSARVDLGPFVRELTREEIQIILFAAKMQYLRCIRREEEWAEEEIDE